MLPLDLFTAIAPHLSFESILLCRRVCKDWEHSARSVVVSKTININCLPAQLRLLKRIRVSGLKVFDSSNARCLMDAYDASFSHLQYLSIWTSSTQELSPSNSISHSLLASRMATVSFSSLRLFHISNMVLGQDGCNSLATALEAMPQAREISLRFMAFFDANADAAIWKALDKLPHLETLDLTCITGLTQFRRVPANLKKLNCHRINLSSAATISVLASLPRQSIREVQFHGFWDNFSLDQATYDVQVFERMNVSALGLMHTLCLENVDMTPSDLNQLLKGRLPATLEKLEMGCNFLGGGGLYRAFANDACFPEALTWLDLSHNNFNFSDIRCAVVPFCFRGLRTLILDGNHSMFGEFYPRPVPVMAFCDVVAARARETLQRIDCNNCGWDELDRVTHRPRYPELLQLTATSAVWDGLYEKKCGQQALTPVRLIEE